MEGISHSYYASGKIKNSTNYENGNMDNLAHIYFENGKVCLSIIYKNNEIISGETENGKKLTSQELLNYLYQDPCNASSMN